MELQGVHTALITPFSDGAVDLDTFEALCTRQINAGADGLVPCGTTGETPSLDGEEWASLVSTAVRMAGGQVPVTAGCGTNSTATTVANISRAKAIGADAALVVLPYYNKPNAAGHRAHIEACCRVGLPVVLYHVPGRTGQRLDDTLLLELCQVPGVIAIKEATGDVALGQRLVRGDVSVLSGDDHSFAALIAMGGSGVISVISNLAPRMTIALARAAAAGDRGSVVSLNHRLQPVIEYLFSDANPVPCKAAMSELGLCSNELRLPLAPGVAPARSLLEGLE
jgi:4-hydroxy-tetrahydrodipicolinate synthase